MADRSLETVLRLVADGTLTAAEAGPIIDELERAETGGSTSADGSRDARRDGRPATDGTSRAIRIEVVDGGRRVVNLRVPVSLGRAALDRIPGLSGPTTDRIREALDLGLTGPILDVDDGGGDGVRIVIE